MALDILFPEGDHQDFIVEIPNGTLNEPIDILTIDGDLPTYELILNTEFSFVHIT